MRKHTKGAHLASRHHTRIQYEPKSPQLTKHVAFHVARCCRPFGPRGHGAAVDTVTIAFPVKPTSCLFLFSTAPLEGWVTQVLPAVSTTDSSFLPLAVTVSPGFPPYKENQRAWRPQWPRDAPHQALSY